MTRHDRSHSSYSRHRVVVVDGVEQEEVCRHCKGTGIDLHHPEADCVPCAGDGTLPLGGDHSDR